MVVVTVYPLNTQTFCMTLALLLADFILLKRVDVGVEIEDGGTDVVLQHPLDNSGGAGGTTGVEENLVKTFGDEDVVLFLHVGGFRVAKLQQSHE